MSNFLVSSLKYRPIEFDDIVGQNHITNILKNAINNNTIAKAFLFCGSKGVGKTSCARIFAKKINNINSSNKEEESLFNIFEIDAASNNSVDDIRNLVDQVRYPPQIGKYKIYIIDEAHMLSNQAFNAFLKTLEEPPSHVVFILATTEKYKIIPTILSRCQIFDFKPIQVKDIKNHLIKIANHENIKYDEDALYLIAQKADGALRDALSIFDQMTTFTNKNITLEQVSENLNIIEYDVFFEIIDLILDKKTSEVLLFYNKIFIKGFDNQNFILELSNHIRNLMISQNEQTISLLEVSEKTKKKYYIQSKKCNYNFLMNAIKICHEVNMNYKESINKRLSIEIALIHLLSLI